MLPAAYVRVPSIPLLPDGRTDRNALPRPDACPEVQSVSSEEVASMEEALRSIWSAVLGQERIGVDDNFFELGGDSIHALQIVANASSMGMILTVAQVFQYQTIGDLAHVAAIRAPDHKRERQT